MDSIIDDPSMIKGVIYVIEHILSSKKYVGQTLSHRKNHARYRLFGAVGRFNDHISEALRNTKRKQCTYLNNAIRLYGANAFKVSVIEECDRSLLDDREKFHIKSMCSLYPTGYNLTEGGKTYPVASIMNESPLNLSHRHGGCQFRSTETRQKMSDSLRKHGFSKSERVKRMAHAQCQHMGNKLERFNGLTIDHSHLDDYIHIRSSCVIVIVGKAKARFVGKYESTTILIERAKEFLKLIEATPPNCSGNP